MILLDGRCASFPKPTTSWFGSWRIALHWYSWDWSPLQCTVDLICTPGMRRHSRPSSLNWSSICPNWSPSWSSFPASPFLTALQPQRLSSPSFAQFAPVSVCKSPTVWKVPIHPVCPGSTIKRWPATPTHQSASYHFILLRPTVTFDFLVKISSLFTHLQFDVQRKKISPKFLSQLDSFDWLTMLNFYDS